ncbi:MAG TPA: hypothetical protein PKI11_20915 [Candidatus Hydrogenedentes bacterium]|nr:hypothetical protein [Candidatus Hydrogenedentota bacterium]HNT86883.1 hypothetical protein [Candidatus Hydrogenedentota bacterium]
MSLERVRAEGGMSLMEVTLAVAVLAGVMAVTAQSLVSFYVSIDIQKQRIEALNSCRAVLGVLREKRHEYAADFPESLLGWVAEHESAGWPAFLKLEQGGTMLREHRLTVACFNAEGSPAAANDNPIRVLVTGTWLDRRGRAMQAQLATLLTDQ